MPPPTVLCIVLAGGSGSRLGPLTDGRAKPSLPVGGHHRLIDIALSNAAHSGLSDVWVLQQYEPHLLNEHLSGGRPWDLDRTRGGFRTLPPYQGEQRRDGFATGNADALLRNWPVIEAFGPDVLLVCSADHLVLLDHRPVIAEHLDTGADATVVTTEVAADADAARAMVVQATDGRVTRVDYKPEHPAGHVVGTEIFLYQPDRLGAVLHELADQDEDLGDYGDRLIPALVADDSVRAVRHDGHWRDLGTPEAYLDGQLELLDDDPPLRLDDPRWPVLTSMPVRAPARIARGAELDRAWVSPGAVIGGTVVNSIVGPGVRVPAGAQVRDSVLMADAVVEPGARVVRSVLAEHVTVGSGAQLLGAAGDPVLVGAGRRIDADATVDAGAQLDSAVRPRRPSRGRG
jgi:glucose-1-phosphate adenylyltransferase